MRSSAILLAPALALLSGGPAEAALINVAYDVQTRATEFGTVDASGTTTNLYAHSSLGAASAEMYGSTSKSGFGGAQTLVTPFTPGASGSVLYPNAAGYYWNLGGSYGAWNPAEAVMDATAFTDPYTGSGDTPTYVRASNRFDLAPAAGAANARLFQLEAGSFVNTPPGTPASSGNASLRSADGDGAGVIEFDVVAGATAETLTIGASFYGLAGSNGDLFSVQVLRDGAVVSDADFLPTLTGFQVGGTLIDALALETGHYTIRLGTEDLLGDVTGRYDWSGRATRGQSWGLNVWATLGSATPPGGGAVPEPSAVALLVAASALVRRRVRRAG